MLTLSRARLLGLLVAGVAAFQGTTPAWAEETIRFAHQKNLFMAPVFVAIEKKLFDENMAKVGYKMDRRSEEHTSELQSLMRTSYAVFCLKKKQHERIYIELYEHQHK